ncbi:MAG: Crp/Fnr family transcriptional regulator [Geminicoccaceae bacterium]|nr:Crp/Fnr family transcriptional regulator [Geminicoccaceae bacterium]MCS7269324.1 Crp/Fnr family transcriptional regulator [Geminicoccaceae bacterium]MCX7630219.1 Crp/Fnr family transcriptional regulator [Geminicoccaceae bacterium]MDW8125498.1 Crp/Fnr family transcriptional regulator [Geminicoccaceae bacterium]MDW8341431.1 Crp/Fnr family transcriptional regulator [Geminicoccaceae bacterium]
MVEPAVAREQIDLLARRTGMTAEEVALVWAAPLFAGLPFASLAALLAEARVREHPRGTVLFLQGDPADRFFVVLDGWIRLYRETVDGAEITIALFARGETFAEAAMLGPGRYPVCAAVAEPARLLHVPASSFLGALETDRALCRNLLASLARRLHAFVRQIETLSRRSSVERLAAFLVKLCEGRKPPVTLRLPLDKSLLAARLGMQPETLSRAFARLRRLGVSTAGHEVRIEDVEALRAYADSEAP